MLGLDWSDTFDLTKSEVTLCYKCLSLFNTTRSVALTNKNDNAQNNVAKIN